MNRFGITAAVLFTSFSGLAKFDLAYFWVSNVGIWPKPVIIFPSFFSQILAHSFPMNFFLPNVYLADPNKLCEFTYLILIKLYAFSSFLASLKKNRIRLIYFFYP